MSDDETQHDGVTWREPILAFVAVVVGLALASLLAAVWGPLANYLLVIAAAIFISVPYFILRRRDADFHRFGIDLERIPLKQVGIGLALALAIFPFYALGYHVWEVSQQEREFAPDLDNYRQWPVELNTRSVIAEHERVIQIRTFANRLHLEWIDVDEPTTSMLVEADHRFHWQLSGALSAVHADAEFLEDRSTIPLPYRPPGAEPAPWTEWLIAPVPNGDAGRLTLSPHAQVGTEKLPTKLEFQLITPTGADPPPILLGTTPQDADEPIEIRRTYWWLLLWSLTHLLLVALPEEYFYRGYLQTRFNDLFGGGHSDTPRTFLGFSRANWLTSALFALGHVLVPVAGSFSLARAAVFFPSLLFGWLRERTGSIIAPVVFHAAANMMVLILAVHYF